MMQVGIHNIERAISKTVESGGTESFDTVLLESKRGHATLFLPAETGQAVADAINAAIAKAAG